MSGKVISSAALNEQQILDVCYYTQLNVSFEVFLNGEGWIVVDWLAECGTNEIEQMLRNLERQYPNERIRVIDKTTGRLIDFS